MGQQSRRSEETVLLLRSIWFWTERTQNGPSQRNYAVCAPGSCRPGYRSVLFPQKWGYEASQRRALRFGYRSWTTSFHLGSRESVPTDVSDFFCPPPPPDFAASRTYPNHLPAISTLASNPHLEELELTEGMIISYSDGESSSWVNLRRLKRLKPAGNLSHIFRFLHQLDNPERLDYLSITVHRLDPLRGVPVPSSIHWRPNHFSQLKIPLICVER